MRRQQGFWRCLLAATEPSLRPRILSTIQPSTCIEQIQASFKSKGTHSEVDGLVLVVVGEVLPGLGWPVAVGVARVAAHMGVTGAKEALLSHSHLQLNQYNLIR